MNMYNKFTRALAYERRVGTRINIPDARLGVGSAEEHRSIARQPLQRIAPKFMKEAIKTNEQLVTMGYDKQITQADFPNTGYIGEVL